MVSDPVTLAVPALAELAVSVYVPEPAPTTTRHELGLNTTWIAAGDATGAASLAQAAGVSTNRSYFWLSGIEVLAPADSNALAAFGDSITDGYATSADAHRAWPALLAQRLRNERPGTQLGVLNLGISGNRVLRDNIGSSALTRFDRDVLARAGVRWMILLEGINDITWSALPGVPDAQKASADQLIEGLSQLVDRAHAHGIKVLGGTLTPMGGLWLFNAQTEALRQAVNAWIRESGKFDAVVDFDAVTRDPADPTRLKPEYDSGDHIHPNDAGNAAMAQAIDLDILAR
jgi:lysophospholipase L1-like esterase